MLAQEPRSWWGFDTLSVWMYGDFNHEGAVRVTASRLNAKLVDEEVAGIRAVGYCLRARE